MCFSSKTPPAPTIAPMPVQEKPQIRADAAAQDAMTNEVQKEKYAKGKSNTILTSPLGVEGSATIQKKTLLGQ